MVIGQDDLKAAKDIPDSIRNEQFDITSIERYCNAKAFGTMKEMYDKRIRMTRWRCGTCKNYLKKGRSILCDRCLNWSHFTCSMLLKNIVGSNWFCCHCDTAIAKGKLCFCLTTTIFYSFSFNSSLVKINMVSRSIIRKYVIVIIACK